MKGFIPQNMHPVYYIMLLLVFMLGGFFVGNFISLSVLYGFFNYGLQDLANVVQNPADYPNGKVAVNLFQGISHFCAFTLGPVMLLVATGVNLQRYLSPKWHVPALLFLLSALLIVVIMPLNSWFIDINSHMVLPDFLHGFELWAKEKEEALKELTNYLIKFDSVGQFVLGMVVFALIPAIGEELVFRGVLQTQLIRWFRQPHVGIWVTAIIFGAIHMQFYGMLPRTLLGALLGYLYWWSGNIWVPIIGHFVNNGFTVLLMYLLQRKVITYQIDTEEAMPIQSIIFSVIATAGLLYYLWQQFKTMPATSGNNPTETDTIF
ncbi:CPBP family intramembrane glutamic endopeptidase [Adhaeribacter rhizoryzae]|uniref:CPBP family intramembrane metalloprotease n=1 Tax=Adhaeribacter rhizoryzae TaxID=2607907 RepID=A0A5M6DD20_9BACT|nr:CPBP family intramembrane glutamic endopeptidase [Adhaeribacter rhizoryzae]KAA5544172.1 CPBP family intramembrane metalloprotease [Adhaeribacter rhizoryzae]